MPPLCFPESCEEPIAVLRLSREGNYNGAVALAENLWTVRRITQLCQQLILTSLILCRVVKTLSKPLTTRLKKEAKRFQNFSNVCVSVGQLTHQFSSRATALASGFRVKEINPLPDEEALARGISFVSETFMFLVAGGIIVIEFNRSEEKNAQKAAAAKQKEEEFRQYLEDRFAAVDQRVQHLEERIAQLEVGPEWPRFVSCFLTRIPSNNCIGGSA